MNPKIKKLTKKERYFCYFYLDTGNANEAAFLAGYSKDYKNKGISLLNKDCIKAEIENLYKQKTKILSYKASIGYERLAFGSISDAIKLLYTNKLDKQTLDNMDLFCISEIRCPKEGAMEIKFFDRIKALEKLENLSISQKDIVNPFYAALEEGIKSLNSNQHSKEEI